MRAWRAMAAALVAVTLSDIARTAALEARMQAVANDAPLRAFLQSAITVLRRYDRLFALAGELDAHPAKASDDDG